MFSRLVRQLRRITTTRNVVTQNLRSVSLKRSTNATMPTSKWIGIFAVLSSCAVVCVPAFSAVVGDREQPTGSDFNVQYLRVATDIRQSAVTEIVPFHSVTIIDTTLSTVTEKIVINAMTATTVISNVLVTVYQPALTSTVFKQAACSVRGLGQEAPLSEQETYQSVVDEINDRFLQKVSLETLRNKFDHLSGDTVKNASFEPPSLVHSKTPSTDNKAVRIYPSNKFTAVMAALSQLVANMKMRDSRPDLVKRYEVVAKADAISYRSPVPQMEELENMAEELLEVSRNGGHESDIFFERMEKFVGYMETIFL